MKESEERKEEDGRKSGIEGSEMDGKNIGSGREGKEVK